MRTITEEILKAYTQRLTEEERSGATVKKYMHSVQSLMLWLDGNEVNKAAVAKWKEQLFHQNRAPSTINGMLTAVNGFFKFCGWGDCCVKLLRIQRKAFRDQKKDLNRKEFIKLIKTAIILDKVRLALLMETLGATGIRVSETPYITVEAARCGKAVIYLKGKIRTIMLPSKLCRKLLKYAKNQKIQSGEIFLSQNGRSMSRNQIWKEMKAIAEKAGVEASKVFPHNLRHLFAKEFYKVCHDIVRLTDVLGHSSIETTRIYLITTGAEHAKILESLKLVS